MIVSNKDIEIEESRCPLCPDSTDEIVVRGWDRLTGRPGIFSVVQCRRCKLMRTNPRPSASSMTLFYPDQYSPYQAVRTCKKSFVSRAARAIVDVRSRAVPPVAIGHMLEVGCAHGGYMKQMEDRGWKVTGIEYSPSAAAQASAQGLRVHTGSLESAPEMSTQFDLITAWMVVEHLHDPVGGLSRLRKWVRSDGWLAFSVPNAGAKDFHVFGHNNFNLDVPRHLFHFTPSTIAAVLKRSGWSVNRILHQRTMASTVQSLGHVCEDRGWHRAGRVLHRLASRTVLTNTLLYPLASCRAMMRQSDRITVWARPAA